MKLGVCKLEDIAQVGLGFKSLQNRFFYVSKKTKLAFKIENTYLRPIFQLKDLDASEYKQKKEAVQQVFYCKDKEQDLHGTGALRYIRAMAKLPAVEKKQTGKHQSIRNALEAQGGGDWYAPKAKLHPANIWLRKAFNCIYSPFIFETPGAVDQRCNYVQPHDGIDWQVVAAVLTSSLFALSAESYGSASMGAGALELPTTKIHNLKVIDIRDLHDAGAKKELVLLAETVWTKTKPVDWCATERPPQEVQELDQWFLSRMGTKIALDRVYSDLFETLHVRLFVAADKDVQTKQGLQINITTVANSIAETVRPLIESRSFPESFVDSGATTQPLNFGRAGTLVIECGPLMDRAMLLVQSGSEDVLIEGLYPRSVAQVIIKALLLGRRSFNFPTDPDAADVAIKEFSKWLAKVFDKIATGCGMSAVGTRYEENVYRAVLEILHLDPHISSPEFYGKLQIN